jgi:GGDEF domain-containing protein
VITLFLVDRFAHLNGRYGTKTGDEVLLLVAHHLGEQLETGSLFRWSGPAFAAITETRSALHEVEQQMARIASKRFEKTIEEDRRMVLLPISCSSIVQKVSDADSVEGIIAILDDFVAAKVGDNTPWPPFRASD